MTNRRAGSSTSFFDGFTLPNLKDIFDPAVLRRDVVQHLTSVYGLLTFSALSAVFGAHLAFQGWLPASPLMALAGLLPTFYVTLTQPLVDGLDTKRHAAVLLAAACSGAGLAPLVALSIDLDPMIVRVALAATAQLFATLTAVSLMSRTRASLMVGGLLGSIGSVLSMVALANLFVPTRAGESVLLWGGLIMLGVYVVLDTQVMTSRCLAMPPRAVKDVPRDALLLWGDLVPIFVRILILLVRNHQQQGKRDRQRRAYAHY